MIQLKSTMGAFSISLSPKFTANFLRKVLLALSLCIYSACKTSAVSESLFQPPLLHQHAAHPPKALFFKIHFAMMLVHVNTICSVKHSLRKVGALQPLPVLGMRVKMLH
jgi:hypothetical protein